MEIQFTTQYAIGQSIYHITPESTKGLIIDILYYHRSGIYYYIVAWNHNEETQCSEIELSDVKVFN